MEIRLLRSYLAIADLGSVTRAAHQVGYSQPAVSQHLAALERHVGDVLFERGPGGMRLTASGHRIFAYAYGIVALADAMTATCTARDPSGPPAGHHAPTP